MEKDTNASDLAGQRKLRIEKLNELKKLGIDPYPAKSYKELNNKKVVEDFASYEGKTVTLAGRVFSYREHGNLIFMDIIDNSGKVQLYIKSDEVEVNSDPEHKSLSFENLKLLDTGDFVEALGTMTKTNRGEISLLVKNLRLLSKSLRPMPISLEDKEERFRRRYLDMALHKEVRERFERRSKFWQASRDFLNQKDFVEINIPVLEHTTGGADAKPFVTHYDALGEDFYLRISHELPLKRLIGAGFEKVYDVGPRFRNEGFSDEHLPEHVAMEWYWAYANYEDGMKLTEEMFRYIMKEVYGTTKFNIRGFDVDLDKEWERIDYAQIIKDKFDVEIYTDDVEKMKKILIAEGNKNTEDLNRNRAVDALWKLIRKTIAGPAFLINEPKFMSPLAKGDVKNENVTQRFHAIVAGSELVNAYSELNDPLDQLDRFVEQEKLREGGDEEAQMLDIDFVEMLEYGMPPTCGWGMSERVFWFFEGITAKEGVPFPQLKVDLDNTTKEIYPELFKNEKLNPKSEKKEAKDVILRSAESGISKDEHSSSNEGKLPTREEAQKLIEQHVQDNYQKLHAKMVGSALESWAKKLGEDENLWYVTGLIHDLDYFEHPTEHPKVSLGWFKDWNYPEELIHAVEAHARGFNGFETEPKSRLAAALMATDELSGFIYAYKMMRPTGLSDMDAKGVKKRLKDKAFAAKINRDDITYGVEKFGVDLDEHIVTLIDTFKKMDELK